ncbi:MAG: 30S ribosomal protein S27ae [Candidatus Thorarchaeota archaeon]|nr:30S ribosomal protein S27ae [Candidatus Thorarchaeota archaeon]
MSHKLYKVDKKGIISRTRRECPRCEKGTFMAEHFDRFACGRCGYTEFKRKDKQEG